MKRLWRLMLRWQLWLTLRWQGRQRLPSVHQRWLCSQEQLWRGWIRKHFDGAAWSTRRIPGAAVQPFLICSIVQLVVRLIAVGCCFAICSTSRNCITFAAIGRSIVLSVIGAIRIGL